MIKDVKAWEEWELMWRAQEPVDYARNLAIFEAMIEHARALGVWPPADPLEGLETCIRMAKALNAIKSD
jgi:hypothetical protein